MDIKKRMNNDQTNEKDITTVLDQDIIETLQQKLAHYRRLAYNDELTEIFNRHGFREEATRIIKILMPRSESDKRKSLNAPISLIFLDIDNFKMINDTHGHDAGDYILQFTAQVLIRVCRKSDIVARWGGEEFLILLPNTDEDSAVKVAEKLRRKLSDKLAIYQEKEISVTASFGVVGYVHEETLDDFIAHADKAMYHAKHELGKNAVATFSQLKMAD